MDNNLLPKTHMVTLGIGIAIGGGLLFALIELWPLLILAGAGYCINKGLQSSNKQTTGAKDAE